MSQILVGLDDSTPPYIQHTTTNEPAVLVPSLSVATVNWDCHSGRFRGTPSVLTEQSTLMTADQSPATTVADVPFDPLHSPVAKRGDEQPLRSPKLLGVIWRPSMLRTANVRILWDTRRCWDRHTNPKR